MAEHTASFRCGACGTEASFTVQSPAGEVQYFAARHEKVCPGFPPSRSDTEPVGDSEISLSVVPGEDGDHHG